MTMNNIQEILQGIWLDKNEAKIYLAVLELWKSWVSEIAKKSWVKRTTIYSYINPLLEKDYIKRSILWKREYFVANKPEQLLKSITEKRKKMIESIPLLEWIYNQHSPNPQLEFYEDKNQIKKLYEEILSSWLEINTFFSPEKFYETFWGKFDIKLWELEKLSWWKSRELIRNDSTAKKFTIINNNTNSKLLPESFKFDVDVLLLWNTIVMVSFEPLYAIKLKNKALTDFQRNIFNYFWDIL